ncbi:MAG TPA: DUF11 domain-containing protein, partial [Phaeodactylibacter sp.]|nr:DUF11 domain-containing protein [Phaeodactylibacter sp.]
MQNLRILFLVSFLFFSCSLFSQDLIINYTAPAELVVCDSNTFAFMLTNASPDTLFNTKVTVTTPTALEYVAGSVSVGTEFNITVPNAPIFAY